MILRSHRPYILCDSKYEHDLNGIAGSLQGRLDPFKFLRFHDRVFPGDLLSRGSLEVKGAIVCLRMTMIRAEHLSTTALETEQSDFLATGLAAGGTSHFFCSVCAEGVARRLGCTTVLKVYVCGVCTCQDGTEKSIL